MGLSFRDHPSSLFSYNGGKRRLKFSGWINLLKSVFSFFWSRKGVCQDQGSSNLFLLSPLFGKIIGTNATLCLPCLLCLSLFLSLYFNHHSLHLCAFHFPLLSLFQFVLTFGICLQGKVGGQEREKKSAGQAGCHQGS